MMNSMNKLKIILKIPLDFWLMFVTYFPGIVGNYLRYNYWKKRLKFLGKNVLIDIGVFFIGPAYITIDDRCWIDKHVIIMAGLDSSEREKVCVKNEHYKGSPGHVFIGKNIHIGVGCLLSGIDAGIYLSDDCGLSKGVSMYSFSHLPRSFKKGRDFIAHFGPMGPKDRQCLLSGPIWIGENTGIALNAIILPGVSVGKNCFIEINSVLSKSGYYEDNSTISGNPAKRNLSRFRREK